MAVKHFQIGRGTYDKAVVYTGLIGELILDTTNMQVRVHDGETMGGYPIAKDVLATSSARGLMAPEDKAKLDTLQNYVLPTAGLNKLGGVKTTSTVTSASGYTACPIISGVPYYANIPAVSLYIGAVDAKADAATSNGATYLKLFSDNTLSKQFNIKGSGATTVTSDASGSLIINSVNTTYTAATNAPLAPGTAAVGTSAKYAREDHVHPVQTTISGNAGTATKLANGAKIGISGAVTGTATLFDGSADITIPTTGIDVSKANAGTLPVARGGTGQTSVANIQAGKDAAGNVITETYATKTEVNNLRSGLVQTVPALPETGTEGIIYLVPNTTDPNTYDQFTWENGAYVPLGNTSFNLGDYVKKENVVTSLSISGRTITYTKGDGTTGTLTTQDNNTTYSAGTGLSLSGTTFSVSSTAGSSALSWGTEVTLGTVGGLAIKAKLPSNPNSDTKVTQNISTTSSTYPVLLTPTANANANVGASTAIFGAGIKANPSTGELIATKFTGALAGNANTATKATQDSAGQQINTTYIKGLSVSGKTITYTKGDGTTGTITTQDTNTTYSVATTSANGLMSADDKAKLDGLSNYVLPTAANGILGGVKTSSTVTSASGYTACPIIDGIPYYKDTNTTYTLSSLGIGNVKNYDQSKAISSITRSGTTFTYTCLDGTTGTFTQQDNNTTYSVFVKSGSGAAAGLVPAPSTTAGTTKYLREDGTWQVPPNTTYANFVKSGSGAKAGLVPAPSTTAGTTKYLREDGTWSVPPNTTYTFTAGTSALAWNTEVTLATVGGVAIKAKLPSNPHSSTATAVRPGNLANGAYSDVVSVSASDKSTDGTANRVATIRMTNGDGYNEMTLGVHNEANSAPGGISIRNTNGTTTTTIAGTTIGTFQGDLTGTATKAIQDSAGQQINTTYIKGLSVSGRTITYTKGDGTTGTITTQDTNTTYSNFVKSGSGAAAGLVPAPSTTAGTTKYLREDGTWQVPPNTTYANFVKSGSGAKAGLVPAPSTTAGTTKYLREDGTWVVPPNTTYTFTAGTSALAWNTEVTLATVGGLDIKAKLPANPNSDTKVTQNISTANNTYPVLLTPTANATANVGANTAIFGSGIKANPSTGELVATKFTGALSGNAATATKATQDSAGQQINTTYIKGLSVSGKTITYTKGDGTTGTITTQDTNTTYTFTAGTSALSWNTEVTLATVGGLAIKAKLPANPNTNTTYSAGAGLALSGTTFSVTSLPSRTTPVGNSLTYCTGSLTIGTANGNLFKGSSNNANLVSAPESGTFYNDTSGNVQNLRLTWSTDGKYLTDIFASPNNDYLWHRNVVNGTAKGWRRLVEENVSGVNAPTWNISVSGTATKATQDSAGQQINTTYIKGLSVSGKTITYTKGDGTTGTITTQDTNTTYTFTAGTSTLSWNTEVTLATVGGLAIKAKLPANPNSDTKVTQNISTANNTYPILLTPTANATANVGATTAIFGSGIKANPSTGELIATKFTGAFSGNASTATKLATARTIALSGAVTGSKTFDGSGNITIPTSLKTCYATVEGEAVTNNIFKFATVDLGGAYNIYNFYILIQCSHNLSSALWNIGFGASKTAGVLDWGYSTLVNNIDLDVSNFFVAYKNNSGGVINIALYCKIAERYKGYRFTVISEVKRAGIGDASGAYLTLINKTINEGTAAVDSGYTVIDTTNATVQGNLAGNAATATKATQDSAGQQINTTYIKGLSVSGKTITYTKGDGTTGTITTQDTNTTYTFTAGTSTLAWNSEVTLATVGGLAIKAKLPANPNTNTTYSAGTGLALSGTTFSVPASLPLGNIEFNRNGASANNGGFIDFHYNQNTADYTSRIIESSSGVLTINGVTFTNSNKTVVATTFKGYLDGQAAQARILRPVAIAEDSYTDVMVAYRGEDTSKRCAVFRVNNGSGYNEITMGVSNESDSAPSGITIRNTNGTWNITRAGHPAFGDHSTQIATTAWVHDNALYTKRSGMDSWSFITSNSSMTNGSMSSNTSMAFAMVASNSDLTTNLVNGKKIGGVGMYASGTSKMSGLKVSFYTSTTAASEAGFDMFTTGNPGSQKVSVLFRHGGHGEVFGPSPSWSSALSANEDTGTVLLGSTHYLWKQVCAKTATIATSDERLKTQIAPIPDEILDAWGDLQYSQFKWIDTVEKEGEAARLHVGAVAQAVERMFQSKGIDVTKYSFFCHTPEEPYEWTEEVEVEPGVKEEKVVKGVHPDRYALRYADMLVIEAVYQRRRADRLEARLSRIEKALNLD